MSKLWNIVIGVINTSDLIIEVVDARVPFETRSSKLENLCKKLGKKVFIVLNKSDLVPKSFLLDVKRKLKEEGFNVFFTSYVERTGVPFLKKAIYREIDKDEIKVSFVGYPNSGKSSLINLLTRRQSAKSSSQPGYTKGEQWIRLRKDKERGSILLLDTPGVIPVEEKYSILKGNIRVEKSDNLEYLVIEFLDLILKKENNLSEVYGIDSKNGGEFLEKLAEKFNLKRKKGVLDLERASRRIIADWNSGKISAWWI